MATKIWLADSLLGWRPHLGYSGSVTFMYYYPLIRYFRQSPLFVESLIVNQGVTASVGDRADSTRF